MNTKKGHYLFGFFVLVGILIFFWKSSVFEPKLEPITFSNEKYPEYRQQIAKRMNAKIQEMTEYPVVPGSWDYTDPSDVEIALVDLNDDHLPEILALIGSRYYTSGVGGIQLEIYSQTKGELKSVVAVKGIVNNKPCRLFGFGVQTSSHIAKLRHKTNGYYDLCWFWETVHPQNDRKHFLVWRDGSYDYGKSKKITDAERGVFPDENL